MANSNPEMYSVRDFCIAHAISKALFYRLCKEGRGPARCKLGSRTLISAQAAAEWRERLEAGETSTAKPTQKARSALVRPLRKARPA